MVSCRLKGLLVKSILPASIFDRSSTSLIKARKWLAEKERVFRFSLSALFLFSSNIRLVRPIIPFSGVLISWLMVARNRLRYSEISSALALAFNNSCSVSLIREMSEVVPIKCRALPLASRSVTVARTFTQTKLPLFLSSRISS